MKKIFILICLIGTFFSTLAREDRYTNSNLKVKIESIKNAGEIFHPVKIMEYKRVSHLDNIGEYIVYTADRRILQEAFSANYNSINFILPLPNGQVLEIYATRNYIFSDDFEESETDESGKQSVNNAQGHFYHGIINVQNKVSVVSISLHEGELSAIICDDTGNWSIGVLKGGNENEYIYFNDRNFKIPVSFMCDTKDVNDTHSENPHPESVAPIKKCVRVFFDCDKSLYDHLGGTSTAPVAIYIQNLFNIVSTLFGQEDVSISISSIHYWKTSDPFSGANSTDALDDFEAYYNAFNGDCAHLLAHDGGNGGRANISAICNGYAYSDIHASYSAAALTFPMYTWDAKVLTHEFGHNFGSRHTHWCGWTGGAIDNCNTCWNPPHAFEGSCTSAPNPPSTGGTIMSYCQGCTEGINFLAGFGTQPGNAIRNFIAGRTCLGNCSNLCIPYVSVGVPVTTGNTLIFRSDILTFGSNTIYSGANATFYAGDEIILNPGFYAQGGSVFRGAISQCTPVQDSSLIKTTELRIQSEKRNTFLVASPNPTAGELIIQLNLEHSEAFTLKLYDFTGHEVMRKIDAYSIENPYEFKTDISELAQGVYFLVLEGNDFRQGLKIVKIE